MTIKRFEDIKAWQHSRELVRAVYAATGTGAFAKDFGLKDQIRRAAGSVMHNIAEGFGAGTNPEFARFLRISQRSAIEVKSQIYIALDQGYITQNLFERLQKQASEVHATCGGFTKYLQAKRPSAQ